MQGLIPSSERELPEPIAPTSLGIADDSVVVRDDVAGLVDAEGARAVAVAGQVVGLALASLGGRHADEVADDGEDELNGAQVDPFQEADTRRWLHAADVVGLNQTGRVVDQG